MADDTFFRRAITELPDGTRIEREWSKSERYQLYARGWRDGAGLRAMRKDHVGLGPYDRGYKDGSDARDAACGEEAKRLGYAPSVLRAADGNSKAEE